VRAYLDESVREAPAGLYLMAAVIVPDARASDIRHILRASLRRGPWRFHWHDETASSRAAMAALVGGLGLDAVVVVATFRESHAVERARARCLSRLVWELDQYGVRDLLMERRPAALMARDRRTLTGTMRGRVASSDLRYGFAGPREECLLWLPDVVAGAAVLAVADGAASYLDPLGSRVSVVSID
jgi:hypothetical protein